MPRRCSANKCQSGLFCIETTTIIFLIIVIAVFSYVMTQSVYKIALVNNPNSSQYLEHPFRDRFHHNVMPKLGARLSNHPRDTLSNPYLPPLKDTLSHLIIAVKFNRPVVLFTNSSTSRIS